MINRFYEMLLKLFIVIGVIVLATVSLAWWHDDLKIVHIDDNKSEVNIKVRIK